MRAQIKKVGALDGLEVVLHGASPRAGGVALNSTCSLRQACHSLLSLFPSLSTAPSSLMKDRKIYIFWGTSSDDEQWFSDSVYKGFESWLPNVNQQWVIGYVHIMHLDAGVSNLRSGIVILFNQWDSMNPNHNQDLQTYVKHFLGGDSQSNFKKGPADLWIKWFDSVKI